MKRRTFFSALVGTVAIAYSGIKSKATAAAPQKLPECELPKHHHDPLSFDPVKYMGEQRWEIWK